MESDAIVNAIFSFIIPGLGQIINGFKKKGIIMLVIAFIIAFAMYTVIPEFIGKIIYGLYALYAAFDAYKTY